MLLLSAPVAVTCFCHTLTITKVSKQGAHSISCPLRSGIQQSQRSGLELLYARHAASNTSPSKVHVDCVGGMARSLQVQSSKHSEPLVAGSICIVCSRLLLQKCLVEPADVSAQ